MIPSTQNSHEFGYEQAQRQGWLGSQRSEAPSGSPQHSASPHSSEPPGSQDSILFAAGVMGDPGKDPVRILTRRMKTLSVAEVVRLLTAVPPDSEFSRIRLLKCLTALSKEGSLMCNPPNPSREP